jgi:RimJ/RimL family protein N-acetyltransferase
MLRERRSGRTIGQMGLRRLGAPEPDAVELYYALMPGYWGRGLATEAARRVVEVGLLELGLTSITAITLLDNAASRAVMRGAGMRRLGTRWHAGAPHVLYGISRAAARASSPA